MPLSLEHLLVLKWGGLWLQDASGCTYSAEACAMACFKFLEEKPLEGTMVVNAVELQLLCYAANFSDQWTKAAGL